MTDEHDTADYICTYKQSKIPLSVILDTVLSLLPNGKCCTRIATFGMNFNLNTVNPECDVNSRHSSATKTLNEKQYL